MFEILQMQFNARFTLNHSAIDIFMPFYSFLNTLKKFQKCRI